MKQKTLEIIKNWLVAFAGMFLLCFSFIGALALEELYGSKILSATLLLLAFVCIVMLCIGNDVWTKENKEEDINKRFDEVVLNGKAGYF